MDAASSAAEKQEVAGRIEHVVQLAGWLGEHGRKLLSLVNLTT